MGVLPVFLYRTACRHPVEAHNTSSARLGPPLLYRQRCMVPPRCPTYAERPGNPQFGARFRYWHTYCSGRSRKVGLYHYRWIKWATPRGSATQDNPIPDGNIFRHSTLRAVRVLLANSVGRICRRWRKPPRRDHLCRRASRPDRSGSG